MNHSPNVAAVAIVIIANWIVAHLATDWVLPQEVQTAFQSLITLGLGVWLTRPKANPTEAQAVGEK